MTGFQGMNLPETPDSFSATPEPDKDPTLPADNLPLKRMPFRSIRKDPAGHCIDTCRSRCFCHTIHGDTEDSRINRGPWSLMMESGMRWTGMKPPRWLTRWSAYSQRLPLEQAFMFPDILFGLLKLPLNPGQTVRERVELWERLLPEVQPFSSVLLREYEKELFAGGRGNFALALHASRMINRKIIRAALLRLFHVKARKRIDD